MYTTIRDGVIAGVGCGCGWMGAAGVGWREGGFGGVREWCGVGLG